MPPKLGRWQISLRGLFGLVATVGAVTALVSVMVTARERAYWIRSAMDCRMNLKQLGVYLSTYASRYGEDIHWPGGTLPSQASGRVVPGGSNGAFWSHLWLLPTGPAGTGANPAAIAKRPGEDALFLCTLHRRITRAAITSTALDYAGPAFADLADFPGGRLSDGVAGSTYIGGDLLLTGDENHRLDPRDRWRTNALRYDGSVQELEPDSPQEAVYVKQTDAATGVRTP